MNIKPNYNFSLINFDNVSSESINEKLLAKIVDVSSIGLLLLNSKSQVICWNKWLENYSGIPSEIVLGKTLLDVFAKTISQRLLNAIDDALNKGMSSILTPKFHRYIFPLKSKKSSSGEFISQLVIIKPINLQEKFCLIQVLDVTSSMNRDKLLRMQAQEHRNKELHSRAILASIADAVITTDINGCIDYMNSVAENITGWYLQDVQGLEFEQIFLLNNTVEVIDTKEFIKQGKVPQNLGRDIVLIKRSGAFVDVDVSLALICDEKNCNLGVVAVFRDVSKERKLTAKINWQAKHDVLTGLYNRHIFDLQLTSLIEMTKKDDKQHALLYLDLDQFKIVNDTCGHMAGDELLKQVAEIILLQVRNDDVLARLGGDEFGILLQDCPVIVALKMADSVRKAVKELVFKWGNESFNIGVSIGVVEISSSCHDSKKLLSAADAACYVAKDSGRNQVHLYKDKTSIAAIRHGEMYWFSKIQSAIKNNKFYLYAQTIAPANNIKNSEHVEILIRMGSENNIIIPPNDFIPPAERYGLMSTIDKWVVKEVFSYIYNNRNKFIAKNYKFAINLSGQTLSEKDTLSYIVDQLITYNIPQGMVTFEITETSAISNLSSANHFIKTLKSLGCLFALDDFGSGLSSFAYLKNLPVDYLKIDGAFVKNMHKDKTDKEMVQAINHIGHAMNIKTIAEFVENQEILDCLLNIGVDYVQGYYIGKPLLLIGERSNS